MKLHPYAVTLLTFFMLAGCEDREDTANQTQIADQEQGKRSPDFSPKVTAPASKDTSKQPAAGGPAPSQPRTSPPTQARSAPQAKRPQSYRAYPRHGPPEDTPLTQAPATELDRPANHGGFFAFAFSPDGQTVAGGTGIIKTTFAGKTKVAGAEVVLWNARTGKLAKTLGRHAETVHWVAYSADGKILASVSTEDGTVKLWDTASGTLKHSMPFPFKVAEQGAQPVFLLYPDGMTMATTVPLPAKSGEYRVYEGYVWSTQTGKVIWRLPHSNSGASSLSPDGKSLAGHITEVADGKYVSRAITLWNSRTGEEIRSLDPGKGFADKLSFLPDGKTLAGITSVYLSLWDIQTGKMTKKLHWPDNAWSANLFFPDGRTLLRADGEFVEAVDLNQGQLRGKRYISAETIWHPAFSTDRMRMACTVGLEGPAIFNLAELVPPGGTVAQPSSAADVPAATAEPKVLTGPADLQIARVHQQERFVRAVVRNAGGTRATGFDVVIFVDGQRKASRSRASLNPGQESFLIATGLRRGTHVYKAVVDPDNKVPESNESNNSKEVTLP